MVAQMLITPPKSITHAHLLSIVHTEMSYRCPPDAVVRLLDAGCGDGELIIYLAKNLPLLHKSLHFEIYGFDVSNHGVQKDGFSSTTMAHLQSQIPGVSWRDRISYISTDEKWCYPDEFFQVIISNQVMEHVNDHELFFSEMHRTLQRDGFSVHLFPLKHYIYEGHLLLPFVHRIKNYPVLFSYIKLLSRLGMGKFKWQKKSSGVALDTYAERHADYLHYFTNYISYKDALWLAKKYKMRISFKYTRELYTRKALSILSMRSTYEYKTRRSSCLDWLSFMILRYISSVTLFLEKRETYTRR
jgi:SAM-dependent methyltransferase